MKIKFKSLNKDIKKLLRDRIKEALVKFENNKIIIPSITLSYNKSNGIEEIMTDREILLQISKDVKSLGTKVDGLEVKVDRNTKLLDKTKSLLDNVIKKNDLKV